MARNLRLQRRNELRDKEPSKPEGGTLASEGGTLASDGAENLRHNTSSPDKLQTMALEATISDGI